MVPLLRDDVLDLLGGASHVLLDVDGVLCLGDEPLLDAAGVVAALSQVVSVVVTTNDSRRGLAAQRARLARAGIAPAVPLVQAVDGVLAALAAHGISRVRALGTEGLVEALVRGGVAVVPPDEGTVEAVVVGCVPDVTRLDLRRVVGADLGRPFFATNRDATVPTPSGGTLVDTGAVLDLLAPLLESPVEVCGKPSSWMRRATEDVVGPIRRAVVVGDGVATDVAWSRAEGWPCIQVLGASAGTAAAPGVSLGVTSLLSLIR